MTTSSALADIMSGLVDWTIVFIVVVVLLGFVVPPLLIFSWIIGSIAKMLLQIDRAVTLVWEALERTSLAVESAAMRRDVQRAQRKQIRKINRLLAKETGRGRGMGVTAPRAAGKDPA